MNSIRFLGINQARNPKKSLIKRSFHDYVVDYKSFFMWYASLNKKEKMLVDLVQDMAKRYRWPFKAAPSHEWLGKQVGYTRQTVCLKLREFSEAGFIRWIYRHRKPSIYQAFKAVLTVALLIVTGNAVSKPLYKDSRHHGIKQEFNNNSYTISLGKTPSGEQRKLQKSTDDDIEVARLTEQMKKRVIFGNECTKEVIKSNEIARQNSATFKEARQQIDQMANQDSKMRSFLAFLNIK